MQKQIIRYDSIDSLLKDPEPKIPADTYFCKLLYWETRFMFGKSAKVILWFIITDGEYAGVTLPSYYNAENLIGKHGRKGRFKVRKKSRFAREFFSVIEAEKVNIGKVRFDRLPVSRLSIVKAKVRLVSEIEGEPLPVAVQYSVIEKIMPP